MGSRDDRRRITNLAIACAIGWISTALVAYRAGNTVGTPHGASGAGERSHPESGLKVREIVRQFPAGPVRGYLAEVDLDDPSIQLVISSAAARREGDPPKYETRLRTVPQIADDLGLTLAVNASFFARADGGIGWTQDAPVDVIGPWISEQRVLSPGRAAGQGEPVLIIQRIANQRYRAQVRCALATEYNDAWGVLGGTSKADGSSGCLILRNGEDVAEQARTEPQARHPRTAAGVTADGQTLLLLVIDGRQPGWSVGVTLPELAGLMKELGARDALNFDGGGSTSLVYRPPNAAQITNRPSGAGWRPVANALGIVVAEH